MNSVRFLLLCRITFCGLLISACRTVISQEPDPEEAKEKSVVDRFVVVLKKNPRRGTALDKVYGYHVERGSLDGLVKTYRDKTQTSKGADAGAAWLIVGLLESLRGQDAAAVTALEQAEKLAPQNYLASYYLGQSLVLVGQPDKAAEALERSIQRKPAQADLLDIYQALGRVYQRAQKTDQAMQVWNRLEKQFPDDPRVQEQIATTLLEENEFAAALPRYESLAKSSKDKYRQSLYQMEAAGLKVRLGKSDEGIAELEKLLEQLLPDNWLYRDVRRRIEAVYLRTDDQSGLITYYENWIKKKPNDLDAIGRLARLLASSGRGPESQEWLQKGLKVAPKSKDLRGALISQLIYEQKYPEAIAQYEQLDKHDPNNPDTLREWGRLVLKDTTLEAPARKARAAEIWRRLTNAKPKDPLVASQVGELFRQAELTDEALELYRKAITLAPEQAQYREYLGEYFHSLKRKDEALAEWRAIAADKLKTAANVARLAEVLASFGYLAEAVETNAEACKLDPKDFLLQVKQVDLLAQAEKHDDALVQLLAVKKLAANDEEREAWLSRDLRELQATEKLAERITAVGDQLEGKGTEAAPETDADKSALWFWLARAYEAQRQLKDAVMAVTKASELAPQSIPILMASARIQEAQNNLMAAVEINTKLAAIDRRYRTEYLKQVATLEQKLGRKDRAVQAGRDLIAAAPGNPELYEFFSHLCFQLGETDEGLGALRRSVRVNPTEPKGLLLLASALSDQFRSGEAIELYWRAFEKAASLEDRLAVVPRLTELYLRTNQLDRILERLERQRREPNQHREMTICLAQAYQSAGDDGNARQELEKLLTEDTRDTQLLNQLVKLCESDGDLEAAVKFQQQLLKSAPGKEGTMRLAQLLARSGETEEAMALMARITVEEKDPETVLKSLDAMLTQGNFESALQAAEKLTRDQPNNWELLYREGYALGKTKDKGPAARAVFESILALKLPDDELCLSEKSRLKKGQGITRSTSVAPITVGPMMQRSNAIRQIRISSGLEDNRNSGGQSTFWVPKDFGQARMASLAWFVALARSTGADAEFIKTRRESGIQAETRREIVDWCYLAAVAGNQRDVYLVLRKLSQRPDADHEIKTLYLRSLLSRGVGPGEVAVPLEELSSDAEAPKSGNKLPVLSKDEMEHVLACYRSLSDPNLQATNTVDAYLQVVLDELKRSGRKDEAEALLKETIQGAKSQTEIATLINAAVERNDFDGVMGLLNRLSELKTDPASLPSKARTNSSLMAETQAQTLGKLMDKRAQKGKFSDVLTLWDWYVPNAVARSQQLKAAASKRNSPNPSSLPRGYVYLWRANSNQYENLDFPSSNEVFDTPSIQMLRQVFSIYQTAETSPELIQHFRQKLADPNTPADQKNFWKFGLGYLHWWLGEKDDALTVLTEATGELQDSQEMRFELARVHEKRGEHDLALEIIDSLPVADQQAMQKREITALRLAVNGGNIDRARVAAERLFGLRLDSSVQIQLAQQMHQLGMHEQAEAVLARAGRQAGNKTDVLANLMQQYQSQGKNEVATQMAYQLLRRSGNRNPSNRSNSNREDNSIRQHAFTVLKRSGKLPEMIKKVEGQLKNSPKSQKLLETLIEYYMANGEDKKAADLASSLAETKQDDPQFRFNLGKQLMEQGKHSEAVGHFKIAFKKDTRLMQNDFYQIMNSFRNAGKAEELAAIFDDLDLKVFRQNPWQLTNVISNLSYEEKSKAHAVKLFKRAWEDMPDQRAELLSRLNNDVFWQMPEIFDYAKQGIIPQSEASIANGSWLGFGQIQNWGNQDGKIVTLITRILSLASSKKKLDELTQEIEAAQKKVPQWEAAPTLLALIDLRRGKIDSAKETFENLLPTFKGANRGTYTQWEIGQELMAHEKCSELSVRYLEAASKDPNVMQMAQMNGFQYSPGKSLIAIYKKRGQNEDARRLLMSSITMKGSRQQGNEPWEAYQRVQNINSLANEVKELGYPVDAIRLYQEQLGRSEDFVIGANVYSIRSQGIAQMQRMKTQIQTGLQAAIKDLRPELLPQFLKDRKATAGGDEGAAPIDLILLIDSRDLDRTQLTSVIGKLVAGLAETPASIERTRAALSEALSKSSQDTSSKILGTLLALSVKDVAKSQALVSELVAFVDQTPLDPAPAKGGFTAKQRDVAMQQVGLWLVARECLKQEALRSSGQKLAERALEASRRLTDNGYSLAILREWGQIAHAAGDHEGAKGRWSEMLDMVSPKVAAKAKSNDDDKAAGAVATAKEKPAKPAVPATQKGAVVTLAQFEQLTQLANLAAENGIKDLSSEAMARALQSGPPIEAMLAIDINQNISSQNAQDNEPSPVAMKVQERLTAIESVWRQKGFSEDSIYLMLEQAVVPEARPFEVFLHPHLLVDANRNGQPNPTLQSPKSVGASLAASCVKANQVERLKHLIEPRLKQPLGELSGRILLAQLALAAKELDQAKEQMAWLINRLKQDSSKTSNELASQIAIPALSEPELRPQATELLELLIDHLAQVTNTNRNNLSAEPLRTFRFLLARSYFQHQNPEAGKRQLEEYLTSLVKLFQNYGGDYGQYLRRIEFLTVVQEYAKAGQRTELLDCLGRYADLPETANYGQGGSYSGVMMSALATLPKSGRYEVLKNWTLPTADRKSVRLVAGVVPGDNVPSRFDGLRGDNPRLPRKSQLTSTADLLIQAAVDSGRLEELQQALQPHAEQNVEQSKFLLQLTRIAQGQAAEVLPEIQALIDERKRPKEGAEVQAQRRNSLDLSDAILARAAISDARLRDAGRELMAQFVARSMYTNQPMMVMGRHDYYAPLLPAETINRLDLEPWNTGLKHWTACSQKIGLSESDENLPSWWMANEGLLSHVMGMGSSQIHLNYPLVGEFEMTCDAWVGAGMESSLGLGYGGTPYTANDILYAQNYGYREDGNEAQKIRFARILHNRFNQVRLQVSPEKVRYYVNGDLIQEVSRSALSSPWLYSYCYGALSTAIRNVTITGQPIIPREVHLVPPDSLNGWASNFYEETQMLTPPDPDQVPELGPEQLVEKEYDWVVKDGAILGRRLPPTGLEESRLVQSRLYYNHPLADGDRIRYEFWYETGKNPVHVHPALGRLAFLLEGDGLKLHWMTAGNSPEETQNGLPVNNVLVDDSLRRGRIALIDNDWNHVELALKNNIVTLSLNGTQIAEQTLEPENSRQFGFYHDKNATSVKVRNVVMQGDWPDTLTSEISSNLLAPSRETTPTERRSYARVIDEKFHAESVEDLLAETRGLPIEDRYRALAKWVLPNEDHPSLRLYGAFASANGIPDLKTITAELTNPNSSADQGRRQYSSPDLTAPVLDLIVVAKELKRLDELKSATEPQPDDDAVLKRSRLALGLLIEIASNQLAEAKERLNQLAAVAPTLPDDAPHAERWPEFVAGHAGLQHAELRSATLPLLASLVDQLRKRPFDPAWETRLVALRDRCKGLMETDQFPLVGGASPKRQWISSRIERVDTHAWGPASRWSFRDRAVAHVGGEGDGYLYFQSPLRGSFRVESEVSTSRWTETRLMYHGNWAGPEYSKTMIGLGSLISQSTGPKLEPALEFDEWCRLELEIQPNKATWSIKGRQVHEMLLPDQPDPWLALTTSGNYSGQARNVRITGTPEIPVALELSSGDDLTGWTASLYNDPMQGRNNSGSEDSSNFAWRVTSGEIVGTKFDRVRNQQRQSLLQYHRPLAEDAELSYEFYYVKGATHVHPSLGRLAYLLEPEGVKVHVMTDADSDRRGLRPDNEIPGTTSLPATASIALNENGWNQLQLSLVGDRLRLKLNGKDVYDANVPAWNQRQFGLFHYANQTDVRVRNVIYRGEWPKTLPEWKDQELSGTTP